MAPQGGVPRLVLLVSGKRKSGKDFVAEALRSRCLWGGGEPGGARAGLGVASAGAPEQVTGAPEQVTGAGAAAGLRGACRAGVHQTPGPLRQAPGSGTRQ